MVAFETGWGTTRCARCGQSLSAGGGTETPSVVRHTHNCTADWFIVTSGRQFEIPEKVKPPRERKRDGKYGPQWGSK